MNITFYKQVALGQERCVQRFVFNAKARPFISSQEMGSQGVDYSARALSKSAHFPQMTIKNDDLNSLEERLNGLEGASCAELKSLHDEIDSQLAKNMSGKNRLGRMLLKALILSRQDRKEEALEVRTQILKEIDGQLAKNMSKRKRLGLMLFKARCLNRQHQKEEALEVCKQIVLLFAPLEPQINRLDASYSGSDRKRVKPTQSSVSTHTRGAAVSGETSGFLDRTYSLSKGGRRSAGYTYSGDRGGALVPQLQDMVRSFQSYYQAPERYCKESMPGIRDKRSAISVLRQFFSDSYCPDIVIINKCLSKLDYRDGHVLFESLSSLNLRPDKYTYATVLKAMDRAGYFDGVLVLYNQIQDKPDLCDNVTYNTVLKAMDRAGYFDGVTVLYNQIQDKPDLCDNVTYNTVSKAMGRAGYFIDSFWP